MKHFYSPSTRGFYRSDVHREVPGDAVEIPAKLQARLLDEQAAGKEIRPHPKTGKPLAYDPAAEPGEQRTRLMRAIKREAKRQIEAVMPLHDQLNALRDPTPESDAAFARIDAIRTASDLIEAQLAEAADARLPDFPVTGHPFWPQENDA